MMGTSHAISGAAVFLALTTPTVGLGLIELSTVELLAGTVVCAGAALLPDADHPNATIAYSVPGGSLVTGMIGAATGGHRKGMHSLIAVAAVLAGVMLLSTLTVTPEGWDRELHLGAAIMVMCCTAFAGKTLRLVRGWFAAWVVGAVLAFVVTWLAPTVGMWLLLAVTAGYATHLVGDLITIGGVPLLWPFMPKPPQTVRNTPVLSALWLPGGNVAVPVLGRTGSWREQLLAAGLTVYTLWCVIAVFLH